MSYKLIAMDLDGTLTQHKSKLELNNKIVLDDLSKKYRCIMVGAGSCKRIFEQMNFYPIEIIGNYGMQQSRCENGELLLVKDDRYDVDKVFFDTTITEIRKLTGYTAFTGDSVEFHPSGAVTFPLIGTKASLPEKLAFDPDGKKRIEIYDLVSSKFDAYNCFIGGTSSFDIVKKQYNKYSALMKFIEGTDIKKEEILFIGDDFKRGGNDEQVMLNCIKCVQISDYKSVRDILVREKII